MPDYKPGDKLRILPCEKDARSWEMSGGPTFQVGDIIEVYEAICEPYDGVSFFVPFSYDGNIFLIGSDNVELVTPARHKCHCPKENFRWNGRGCVCNGE